MSTPHTKCKTLHCLQPFSSCTATASGALSMQALTTTRLNSNYHAQIYHFTQERLSIQNKILTYSLQHNFIEQICSITYCLRLEHLFLRVGKEQAGHYQYVVNQTEQQYLHHFVSYGREFHRYNTHYHLASINTTSKRQAVPVDLFTINISYQYTFIFICFLTGFNYIYITTIKH